MGKTLNRSEYGTAKLMAAWVGIATLAIEKA